MTDLDVLVPALARPHRVAPLLDSLEATTTAYRVLFICDHDDDAELEAIAEDGRASILLPGPEVTNYAQKINAAVKHTEAPLLFLAADDLTFHPGWLDAARAKLKPGIGVVGTQDRCNPRVIRGEHATHFLVTREYAELGQIDGEPGVLCEVYGHEKVDDELIATAATRGAYAFANDSVVEHLHPDNAKTEWDSTYEKGRMSRSRDRRLFQRRQRLWAE